MSELIPKTTEESGEVVAVAPIPQIILIRHLERIDKDNKEHPEDNWSKRILTDRDAKAWNLLYKDYNFIINPFLKDKTSINALICNLKEIKIDHIVCSPFIRCIQTAILVANSPELTITDKIIHINYGLGEIIDYESGFRNTPVNMKDICDFSKKYIAEHFKLLSYTLEDTNPDLVITKFEKQKGYDERVLKAVNDIRSTFKGNILIVAHSYTRRQFSVSGTSGMSHGKIYPIYLQSPVSYKDKYIKYKTKYLELKAIL